MSNSTRKAGTVQSVVALVVAGTVMTLTTMAVIAWFVLMLKFAVSFYYWLG